MVLLRKWLNTLFIHEEERALNMNSHTIEEVVELGKEYDLSYGYMTAKLEGRI